MNFWPKMGVLWGKIGEGVVRYWPLTNSFFLFGVFTSVPIFVKIDPRNATVRVLADGQIHWQTDTLTDANRFYNLSHAICYSYGTDNEGGRGSGMLRVSTMCSHRCYVVFSCGWSAIFFHLSLTLATWCEMDDSTCHISSVSNHFLLPSFVPVLLITLLFFVGGYLCVWDWNIRHKLRRTFCFLSRSLVSSLIRCTVCSLVTDDVVFDSWIWHTVCHARP